MMGLLWLGCDNPIHALFGREAKHFVVAEICRAAELITLADD
jgi:hypothetical protein